MYSSTTIMNISAHNLTYFKVAEGFHNICDIRYEVRGYVSTELRLLLHVHLINCLIPDPLTESEGALQYAGNIAGISAKQHNTSQDACVPRII